MTVYLDGLNCAHCAAKIHSDIQKLPYISNSELSLVTKKLTFDSDKGAEKALKDIKQIVKKYEPDVVVTMNDKSGEQNIRFSDWAHLIPGGILLIISFFVEFNSYLFAGISVLAYIITGYKILIKTAKNIKTMQFLDENLLMTIASIGAIALGEYSEAVAVMLFYSIGEILQDSAVNKSRASIKSLMNIRPDTATVTDSKRNAYSVPAQDVKVGDIILIKPQERIPLDCIIVEGSSTVDTSSITGESVPQTVNSGDELISGAINISGAVYARVTAGFSSSTATKILELMESSIAKKSKSENFITKFAKVYTPLVVLAAILIAVIPLIIYKGENFSLWLNKALTFLVISCPCALVISIPLSFFRGIGVCSKQGILIKGSNYLEALSKTKSIVFDKTGTLTYGKFSITKTVPTDGVDKEELISAAAAVERLSSHPIAKAFQGAACHSDCNAEITDFEEIAGMGVSGILNGEKISAGNAVLMKENGIDVPNTENTLGTTIHIAKENRYMGYIIVSDTAKKESKSVLAELKKNDINTVMLSGDNLDIANSIANEIGIDNIKANLMPADKVKYLEEIIAETENGATIFVGDGMNDAPSLALADIGIAMGGVGTDAAIESADIVIMSDNLSKIPQAIKIAKFTRKIVIECIVLTLTVKLAIMVLNMLGLTGMWAAVFADVGVSFLAILNTFRQK